MSDAKPASRWRHDADLKRKVIAACAAPGASVAQVAMSFGLNANLVHKWRRVAGHDGEPAGSPAFVPVSVVTGAPPREPPQPIELELQRGPVHVHVRWPMASASCCAAWLREMLR
jgi:transposase